MLLGGCQTPDLKPFASATATVVENINRGGDLVMAPVARLTAMSSGQSAPAGDTVPPPIRLAASWQLRRRAADAMLSYSGALAAISDAAANRRANAAALVDSVRQLAAAVPGITVGSNAASDLVVSGAVAVVEVKAWHDLGRAVAAADPAVQMIAQAIRRDLAALAFEYENQRRLPLMTSVYPALRELERDYEAVKAGQRAQRAAVARNPADVAAGSELLRRDTLVNSLEPELNARRTERAQLEAAIVTGREFYQAADSAIGTWAAVHHDLVRAFAERRAPNLALLAERATELSVIVRELSNEHPTPATP